MSKKKDFAGLVFERLTVVQELDKRDSSGNVYWLCQCECGGQRITTSRSLNQGTALSCGCLRKERAARATTSHGGSGTRLHEIWRNMKRRCYNPRATGYDIYGGRGIQICDEWKENFDAFRKWSLSNGYSDDLTIDRQDSNGNYEPDNCRWVTHKDQANNKRNNKVVTINGVSRTTAEWSEFSGIKVQTIHSRIRAGWKSEDLLKLVRPHKKYEYKGEK